MKAKRIIATNPPERGILKFESAKIKEARLKRQWARFNRLIIGEVLGELEQMRLADESKIHAREFKYGLFEVMETARKVLMEGFNANGIITQRELELFVTFTRATPERDRWLATLVSRVQAGYLVEPGPFFMCNDRVCLNNGRKRPGESLPLRPERSPSGEPSNPLQADPQTPTAETLQTWFDMPSDRPPAQSSPAAS